MALRVKELVLRLLCSLKLANNPSLDSGHCRVTTKFFSKVMGFPSLYESCQPLELVHLTGNSHRFENNKVDNFAYFYNFQYQDCVIQIAHVDCEFHTVWNDCLKKVNPSQLIIQYVPYLVVGDISSCLTLVSLYALQGRSSIKLPRYRLDSLKFWPLVLMHIFINYFRFHTTSYIQRCSPGLSCY